MKKRKTKTMANAPVNPNTHPTWLQRHMEGFRAETHAIVEAAKAENNPERALEHVEALANQVEYLGSIVHALVNHVARQR